MALAAIEQLPAGGFDRLQLVDDAVNALIAPDTLRREFFAHERYVTTLYNAVKPDPAAVEFTGRVSCLAAIAEAIRAKLNPNPADITHVMGQIAELLDVSITGAEIAAEGPPPLDLSRIDFEALSQRFKKSKTKNTDLEVLKAAIRAQLDKLIRINRTRADYLDKFEELIEAYNNGSRSIEELFEELLKLSRSLSEEQKRHVRENLSEDELTIFDLLTRPDPALTDEERAEVKKVARLLHDRLKDVLTLDWRQKSSARASVLTAIKDTLDEGLPRAYTPEIYEKKCSTLFEHIYEIGAA